MSEGDVEAVVAAVRERIDPDDDERERMRAVTEEVLARTAAAVADLPVEADALQVGSTARGTWLASDRDVDVFVRFPSDLPREKLEAYGLQVGREVLPDGHEEYAEHPYVVGEVDGFAVDLVPCYRLDDATEIQSSVDRTPFHNRYLDERIDEDLAAEVRVFKQFCKGIGVYGSDLRTQGLSGYLTELLVLEYGSFRATLEAAADWHPPVRLDPEDHGRAEFDDPLVVIDPTDPERNVAAVTAPENVARLQHHARAFLANPTVERFFPDEPDPLDAEGVREHVRRRGTTPVAVRFDAPDLVDDQLYPQLRKSLAGLADELDRREFDVFRTATWADDEPAGDTTARPAVLFVELAVAERPRVERHDGPPVHAREHAEGFYAKYADETTDSDRMTADETIAGEGTSDEGGTSDGDGTTGDGADGLTYGPFVDGDRYVVEREREFATACEFVEDALLEVALGVHVEDALREGYDVLVGEGVAELAGDFGAELAWYFDPGP